MKKTKLILGMFVLASALIFTVGCDEDNGVDPNTRTNLRVIHTSFDAPNVDASIDGTAAITDLAYGEASGYAEIEAGSRNITVTPNGATSPVVIDASPTLDGTKEYTVFAVGALTNIEPLVLEDDRSPVSDKAKIRFLHASPDAPEVNIRLNTGDGPVVFGAVEYKEPLDYVEVDGGSYTFVVTGTGSTDALITFEPVTVANGSVYTVVAHGTFDAGDSYPFAVRVFVDDDPGSAFVDLIVDAS